MPSNVDVTLAGRRRTRPVTSGAWLRVVLPAVALGVMLGVIFVRQPLAMSYFGLTLLLNFSLPLVFAAAAQMCIIAAGDTDLGIGPFLSLVNCIAATLLTTRPAIGAGALVLCVLAYGVMGALIHLRQLPRSLSRSALPSSGLGWPCWCCRRLAASHRIG